MTDSSRPRAKIVVMLRSRSQVMPATRGDVGGFIVRAHFAPASRHAYVATLSSVLMVLLLGTACTSSSPHAGRQASKVGAAASASARSTSSARPAAPQLSSPVPQRSPGNAHVTVAARKVTTLAPVALSATAHFGNGVAVSIVRLRKLTAQATRPGELSGPVISIEIAISNGSRRDVSVGNIVANTEGGDRTPLVEFRSNPSAPMSGSLSPGRRATGVYVFELPASFVNPLALSVKYSVDAPVALFVGDVK